MNYLLHSSPLQGIDENQAFSRNLKLQHARTPMARLDLDV